MNETTAQHTSDSKTDTEVLVFTLGEQEYGIDILKIQEIRGYSDVTHIANTPEFVKGVTNLRGVIVPIVDLRLKFAMANAEFTEQTVVIVLNIGERVVGVVVDGVSDVLRLTADQIKPAPDMGGGDLSTEYLWGLGSVENRMLILVDAEKLINNREMTMVDQVAG